VLNVWSGGLGGANRPVLVWFHGGGYAIGSGSWPTYEGANLARRGDAVVVTVNHRLGALGYLHLGELAGPGYESSGNVGMLDLVQSLEWVRDNIARFGGDPDNVTIFGESGGGAKVSTLLAMPAARGLFHRAAIQSGPGLRVQPVEAASALASKFLAELGVGADQLEQLASLPVEQILAAQQAILPGGAAARGGFAPVLDGAAVTAHPGDALADGSAPDVPLLVGCTRDEATLFLAGDPKFLEPDSMDRTALERRLDRFGLGQERDRILATYAANRPNDSELDLLVAILTDQMMRLPSIALAERKLSGGSAPVFMYLFTWSAGPLRSAHGFEIPFVFDNVGGEVMAATPTRQILAGEMSEAWLAFARHGDPVHDGLADWPAYNVETRPTMIFDRGGSHAENDPWGEDRRAWDGITPRSSLTG
jgi:para-nitrobenzyl esterase